MSSFERGASICTRQVPAVEAATAYFSAGLWSSTRTCPYRLRSSTQKRQPRGTGHAVGRV
eukprot:797811-Rhodomonas_salina.1